MNPKVSEENSELRFLGSLARTTGRRKFVQWAGLTLGVVALGCSDDNGTNPTPGDGEVNLGTGDTGVLNYAYALEQLEAAFYTEVLAGAYFAGAQADEKEILTDIRNHEVIHRDFLKAALGTSAIADLTVTFASVNMADRASVLGAAQTFEDLGVSAYNGAGQLLTDASNLLVAGKIVSVEARHAAAIRDLLVPKSSAVGSFAGDDTVDPTTGLEIPERTPTAVLTAAATYVTTTINASGLPTS
ncbi:MAG: ferritin-like domain-containing protein [Gemmatimonadales bacterium]